MAEWTKKYKQLAYSSYLNKVIVRDPDDLLSFPELQAALAEDGYKVYRASSDLEARLIFELEMRDEEGKVLLSAPKAYQPLPDMALMVHDVDIGLRQLFPLLAASALKGISPRIMDWLCGLSLYETLGHDKTLLFLLANYYHTDLGQRRTRTARERLLNTLAAVLLDIEPPHPPLLEYLEELTRSIFPDLAGAGLSRQGLIQFLQERWPAYLYSGPGRLDFQEPELMKTMSLLFVKGVLAPVEVSREKLQSLPPVLRAGAYCDAQEAIREELRGMTAHLRARCAHVRDLPEEWFDLAPVAAKAMQKALTLEDGAALRQLEEVIRELNERFQQFIEKHYEALFSRSGARWPVTVARILDYIKAQPVQRVALLVIDGMNYWQWELLAEKLHEEGLMTEAGVTMAYIPSITAWSRQAIFRGGEPELETGTEREPALFKAYWQAQDVAAHQIAFERWGIHSAFSAQQLSPSITHLAVVCNDLDDILHGTTIGNRQLHASTRQWIARSGIATLVRDLKSCGFTCFLTSDHGNIEATGIKNLRQAEKAGARSRSKRHLWFSNPTMMQNFLEQNPSLHPGISGNSVYLKNEEAFTVAGTAVVTHGGSHFWEVLIPLVQL